MKIEMSEKKKYGLRGAICQMSNKLAALYTKELVNILFLYISMHGSKS
jgi:hypothetical protein